MIDLNRLAASRSLPGLPAVRGLARQAGATKTDFERTAPIEVAASPRVKISPFKDGDILSGVLIEITLKSRYAASMDENLRFLNETGRAMVRRFEQMSQGPLSSRTLAKMGHPYGRDKNNQGRRVPRRVGFSGGARGSVPTLTVINRQSGELARGWEMEVRANKQGATLRITNEAKAAYLLAAGTRKMIAHGPFSYLPVTFRSQLSSAWQKEIYQARAASIARSQAEMSLGVQ